MPDAQLMEVASHGELEKALARSRDVSLVLLDLRMPPVTMQFAMPNPADVEASCNVD
jgi:hypothetical protein